MIELYNMDCMEGMKQYPDKHFELAIVDPPYGIGDFTRSTSRGKAVNRNYKRANWNDLIPTEEYFIELKRVSKNQIIWGANYYNCFPENGGSIVWDKGNNHPDMSRCEIASNSTRRTVSYFNHFWAGFSEKERVHPCQKPVALYKWLLTNYAKTGDKILDTHLGSGSIALACHELKFDLVGYEIDKDYFDAAQKRLKNFQMQATMF